MAGTPSHVLDPRLTAARGDVAAAELEGMVEAERYVEGERRRAGPTPLPLRKAPDLRLGREAEVLPGESFRVLDEAGGFAWGQIERDGYVGYVESAALVPLVREATHLVAVPSTLAVPRPDAKVAFDHLLPMNARVRIVEEAARWSLAEGTGWIPTSHLEKLPLKQGPTPLATARLFLGRPYVWGGNTGFGMDCSGLVQIALDRAGKPVPRDSDMQEAALGHAISPDAFEAGDRKDGDLVFFPGHVGFLIDGDHLLHANAHTMNVAVEPLADVVERVRADGSRGISSVRRL